MSDDVPPDKDIGPFYKFLAILFGLGGFSVLLLHSGQEGGFSWIDFSIFLVIVMFVILLIRPDKFDNLIKSIADKIPFLKYKKDDDNAGGLE